MRSIVFAVGIPRLQAGEDVNELALPWRELREEEQSRVLAGLAEDVRVAVGDAVRAIASNERITFRAEVEKVEFKGATDVKAVLKMVTSAEAHSLADVAGVCDHIRKELAEVEESGGSLAEWIDVVILALDGAWRSGATPEQIVSELVAKQTKNEGRRWPDWRTADTGKAIEHDRTEEAS